MKDESKTRPELIEELEELRRLVEELKRSNSSGKPVQQTACGYVANERSPRDDPIRNLEDISLARQALLKREAILEAVRYASETFLKSSPGMVDVNEMLGRLGKAMEVSRVYIFENHHAQDGTLLTSQRFEWVADGIQPQLDNPELQNLSWQASGYGRWAQALSQGNIICGLVRQFPESERRLLAEQSILSLIIVPIIVGSEWWGFIGFDDCITERKWSSIEIDALQTAAHIIGIAIERMKQEESLKASEARYRAIIEDQTELILRFKPDGTLTFVNNAYCRYFGERQEALIGNNFWHHLPDDERKRLKKHLSSLNKDKPVAMIEHRVFSGGGEVRWQQWTDRAIFDEQGRLIEFQAVGRDVTELKQAEQSLRESERKYRELADLLPQPVFEMNLYGTLTFANRRLFELFGYDIGDFEKGLNVFELFSPEDRELLSAEIIEHYTGKKVTDTDCIAVKKDGSTFPVILQTAPVKKDNCITGMRGIIIDITERKSAEQALQASEKKLRYLSSQLLTAQEREQKRISKELHDELGQSLLALKLQVRSIEKRLGKEQVELRKECADTLRYIDEVIENVRRISRDLSPLILENLGISSALRWLVDDITRRSSCEYSIAIDDIDDLFDSDAQVLIFRVFQECFTNIAKHAEANHVSVIVSRTDYEVFFQIEDDGSGFDLDRFASTEITQRGLGLAAMDERVRMLGGKFDIWSQEGIGTKVVFTIPVSKTPLHKSGNDRR